MNTKATLRLLTPPIIYEQLRRLMRPAIGFTGNYRTWIEACAAATGYDSDEILRRVLWATRQVVAGNAVYERDSVLFDHIEYSWPLLASLLQIATESGALRVIDFGGSLGSTWRQNGKFLKRLGVPMAWRVVEQPHFVAAGRAEFSDEILQFHHSISEASEGGVDVVLFCSSLCYVPDPDIFLREVASTSARYLIADRLPLTSDEGDRVVLQKIGEPIYTASYPIRLFAERNFLSSTLKGWRLIERWECDLQPHPEVRCQGFFMERQ